MSLIGLDLNASRARAVTGPRAHSLAPLPLDGDQFDLPLAISLEGRQPQIGRAGLALSRRRPHLACLDFLPHITSGKQWTTNNHRIDADRALGMVFATLATRFARSSGCVLAVPAYLGEEQLVELRCLASTAKIRLLGTLPAPLAAVLAAYGDEAGWPDPETSLLVVDVDGHALTWSVLQREDNALRLRLVQPSPHLGRLAWLRKLMDGVAHRCVRQSRRDPRESAETDQTLYEQLTRLLDTPAAPVSGIRIQGAGWYHHMNLSREDLVSLVLSVLRQAIAELDGVLTEMSAVGRPVGAILTSAAAGLPGLANAIEVRLSAIAPPAPPPDESDLGDCLVSRPATGGVQILSPDALARAAHALSVRIHRGDAPSAHPEGISLPAMSQHADLGPARLSFRGEERLLTKNSFVMGRDPSCDMVFETELYPHVSGRHCAILLDHSVYTLHDYSRHGTFINDRPISQSALHTGDWIRLGPQGPLLRFLGQPT